MDKISTTGFEGRMGRIEELIHSFDGIGDADVRANARELVQALLDLHGEGIERMLEITDAAGVSSDPIIAGMVADPLVSNLLLVHGLHPISLEARVQRALETVAPQLALHGGSVELVGISERGEVRLKLEGNCHGCPSSRVTLKYSIEEAIYATAPDVSAIEVAGVADLAGATNSAATIREFTECPSPNQADRAASHFK